MIEVRLESSIISFDGRVIEAFSDAQEARRYHVAHVKTAELPADKKGRHVLRITMEGRGGILTGELSPEALQQAQQLVAEIEKARASL
jgi:regulator of protease activity HflC (stomatin/prohibitin superfamily)